MGPFLSRGVPSVSILLIPMLLPDNFFTGVCSTTSDIFPMGRKMKSYGLKVGGAGAVVHQGKEDAEAAGGASYASCADC